MNEFGVTLSKLLQVRSNNRVLSASTAANKNKLDKLIKVIECRNKEYLNEKKDLKSKFILFWN